MRLQIPFPPLILLVAMATGPLAARDPLGALIDASGDGWRDVDRRDGGEATRPAAAGLYVHGRRVGLAVSVPF